jgi:phenol hydroxylase P2 protein
MNMADKVLLKLQDNEQARPIVEAIEQDNQQAHIEHLPGMVRIESPGRLTVNRLTVSEKSGRDWDIQELQLNLVSLSGNIDEDDDYFTLAWSGTTNSGDE